MFMKHLILRTITMILVQQLAMIFFMRVVGWDIFVSAGLSAMTALIVGFSLYFIHRRTSARKSRK